MTMTSPVRATLVLVLLLAAPVVTSAQVADHLSSFGPENASGYVEPVRTALAASLASGLFPRPLDTERGFRVSAGMQYVLASYRDEDRSFRATAPLGFPRTQPDQTDGSQTRSPVPVEIDAPTVVGSTEAVDIVVPVSSDDVQLVRLPGGLDLSTLSFGVPQLNLGYRGTDLALRYLDQQQGTSEIGDVSVFGVGIRQDVTESVDRSLMVRLALIGSFHDVDFAEDLMSATLWSAGVIASRSIDRVHLFFELAVDSIELDVSFADVEGRRVSASERDTTARVAAGAGLSVRGVGLNGQISFNRIFGVNVGATVGF